MVTLQEIWTCFSKPQLAFSDSNAMEPNGVNSIGLNLKIKGLVTNLLVHVHFFLWRYNFRAQNETEI